jgi:tetratricopeptide (TPR) repeat protein
MKTLNKIYLLIVILAFISCDSYLDVEPKGKIIPQTIKDYDLLLNGGHYKPLNSTGDGSAYSHAADDFVSIGGWEGLGDITDPLNTRPLHYKWNSGLFRSDKGVDAWNLPYRNIYTYNVVINSIDKAKAAVGYSDADKKIIKAEALLGRAFEYWLLVNAFGKQYSESTASTNLGVPIITSADVSTVVPARATVKKVYDFIIKDVEESIKYLPKKAKNRVRPSKGAGYAMLARFYLWMNKYDEALKNATLALAEKSTVSDYDVLMLLATEGVTAAQDALQDLYDKEAYVIKQYRFQGGFTSGTVAPDVVALFTAADLRKSLVITNISEERDDELGYVRVETDFYRNARSFNINLAPDIPEMYLIRAECNARKGDIAKVVEDLNILISKRTVTAFRSMTELTEANFPSKEAALGFVLQERRREMILTGMRLFDLKRLNLEPAFAKDVVHTIGDKTYTAKAGSNKLIFPIPAQVLHYNPNMKQNPID